MTTISIISRADARAFGSIRYFTGMSCPAGHVAERFVSTSSCCECGKERGRRPASWTAQRVQARETRAREKHEFAMRRVEARHAIETTRVEHVPAPPEPLCPPRPKDGLCQCCFKLPKHARFGDKLVLDHNHYTGEFRGWICDQCNRAAGLVGDNSSGARLLLAYLERADGAR